MPFSAIWPIGHRPANLGERCLVHSIPLVVAIWGAYFGLVALLESFLDTDLTTLILMIPLPIAVAVGVFQIVGNTTFALGLLNGNDDISVGWHIERKGIALAISGWMSYAVSVFITDPRSTVQWTLCLTMSLGLAGRAVLTWRAEHHIRSTMIEEEHDAEPPLHDHPPAPETD